MLERTARSAGINVYWPDAFFVIAVSMAATKGAARTDAMAAAAASASSLLLILRDSWRVQDMSVAAVGDSRD